MIVWANKKNSGKLGAMLSKARANRPVVEEHSDAPNYNWMQARHFSSVQMQKLEEFAGKLGKMFCMGIEAAGNGKNFKLAGVSVNQRFYKDIDIKLNEPGQFFKVLSTDGPCGVIAAQGKGVLEILARLLGDSEPDVNIERVLSPLERCTVNEIFAAAANSLRACVKEAGGMDVKAEPEYSTKKPDMAKYFNEEACEIEIRFGWEGSEQSVLVVLLSGSLDAAAGSESVKSSAKPEELQQTMLGHICPVGVRVDTRLASMQMKLGDIMSLQEDDVLVFGKAIAEPMEVIVAKRSAFAGRLAQNEGRFAVVIEGRTA